MPFLVVLPLAVAFVVTLVFALHTAFAMAFTFPLDTLSAVAFDVACAMALETAPVASAVTSVVTLDMLLVVFHIVIPSPDDSTNCWMCGFVMRITALLPIHHCTIAFGSFRFDSTF